MKRIRNCRWIYGKTPAFIEFLKPRKTKRLSPYYETEIWENNRFLSLSKYGQFQRNKAALALLWDLDVRLHEITLLKNTHICLKEKCGDDEFSLTMQRQGKVLFYIIAPFLI